MEIYKEEAIRIAPMYYIGCETHEEKETLTAIIESALRWGGFKKELDENKSYFSGFNPYANMIIVSKVLDIPISSILEDLPIAKTAKKFAAYISYKDNDIKSIAEVLRCSTRQALKMITTIQMMVDAKDGYTVYVLEKIHEGIIEYQSNLV